MYVIVRTNISTEQQIVQSCHASAEAARNFLTQEEEHPSVIVVVVKSEYKLQKLAHKLQESGIKFKDFRESDINNELTAIATRPLYNQEREIFSNYQLWRSN